MCVRNSCSCSPPPGMTTAEAMHPRYPEYMEYREALTKRGSTCPAFTSWLYQVERVEEYRRVSSHPRSHDYRRWLRDNVNCVPPKAEYMDFWTWLES